MILLVILDGWGVGRDYPGNATYLAKTPFMDMITREYPTRSIFAHGEYVGLPKGQMGNSEVGHLNIGGGRKIRPDLVVINDLIKSGEFFNNEVLLDLIAGIKARGGRLHVMGLLSDGGIHSHIDHLRALLEMIDRNGHATTFLHAFLDGRDTEPKVADKFIGQAQRFLDGNTGQYFRTIGGRSWGMDRDNNWERVGKHYDAIARGKSDNYSSSAIEACKAAFEKGETDEFVTPTVIEMPGGIDGRILEGDGVIHFNFRSDRAIQMTRALTDADFNGFDVKDRPEIDMVTFTMYDEYLNVKVAFEGEILKDTLTEVVSNAGGHIFKIAETEKWAHVTKFFNGGETEPFPDEDRLLIQSPLDVRPNYDKKPEMSSGGITENLIERIRTGKYELIVANYANPDMVGHTGFLEAAIRAVEAVDGCLKRVLEAVNEVGGTMIIIGDHGNCEEMVDENGHKETKHSVNPVPFIITDKNLSIRKDEGSLSDIAPTILRLLNLKKPEAMTGKSLVV
ncbi:MAG: 2,3-bisphosphoglycerate-independent phosphoglycerate mutase [bacterium]